MGVLNNLLLWATWTDTISLGNVLTVSTLAAALFVGARVGSGAGWKATAEAARARLDILETRVEELEKENTRLASQPNLTEHASLLAKVTECLSKQSKILLDLEAQIEDFAANIYNEIRKLK